MTLSSQTLPLIAAQYAANATTNAEKIIAANMRLACAILDKPLPSWHEAHEVDIDAALAEIMVDPVDLAASVDYFERDGASRDEKIMAAHLRLFDQIVCEE